MAKSKLTKIRIGDISIKMVVPVGFGKKAKLKWVKVPKVGRMTDLVDMATKGQIQQYDDLNVALVKMYYQKLRQATALKIAFVTFMQRCCAYSYMGKVPTWFKEKLSSKSSMKTINDMFNKSRRMLILFMVYGRDRVDELGRSRAGAHLLVKTANKKMAEIYATYNGNDAKRAQKYREAISFKEYPTILGEAKAYEHRFKNIYEIVHAVQYPQEAPHGGTFDSFLCQDFVNEFKEQVLMVLNNPYGHIDVLLGLKIITIPMAREDMERFEGIFLDEDFYKSSSKDDIPASSFLDNLSAINKGKAALARGGGTPSPLPFTPRPFTPRPFTPRRNTIWGQTTNDPNEIKRRAALLARRPSIGKPHDRWGKYTQSPSIARERANILGSEIDAAAAALSVSPSTGKPHDRWGKYTKSPSIARERANILGSEIDAAAAALSVSPVSSVEERPSVSRPRRMSAKPVSSGSMNGSKYTITGTDGTEVELDFKTFKNQVHIVTYMKENHLDLYKNLPLPVKERLLEDYTLWKIKGGSGFGYGRRHARRYGGGRSRFGYSPDLTRMTGYVRPMRSSAMEQYTGMTPSMYRRHLNSRTGNPMGQPGGRLAQANSYYGSYALGEKLNPGFGRRRRRTTTKKRVSFGLTAAQKKKRTKTKRRKSATTKTKRRTTKTKNLTPVQKKKRASLLAKRRRAAKKKKENSFGSFFF
jgi:hypothetical protein